MAQGEQSLTSTATIKISKGDTIGKDDGTRKPKVYRGVFGVTNVAIKAYLKAIDKEEEKELKSMKRDLVMLSSEHNRHPNFIRYYGEAEDANFSYLATELCVCSVGGLIARAEMPHILDHLSHKEILRQSAEAVRFLHGLGLIHRNLHPENFLIAQITDHYLVKLTDFHFTKDWAKSPANSGNQASYGWVAPETPIKTFRSDNPLEKTPGRATTTDGAPSSESPPSAFTPDNEPTSTLIASSETGKTAAGKVITDTNGQGQGPDEDPRTDVYILGCFFYYVLSGGKHPFGSSALRRGNIRKSDYKVYNAAWDGSILAKTDNVNDVIWGVTRSGGKNPFGGPEDNKEGYEPDWKNSSPWWKREAFKALDLIKSSMIKYDRGSRKPMEDVLKHPYFDILDLPDPYKIYEDEAQIEDETDKKPGLCIIVSQDKFQKKTGIRQTPELKYDAARLSETFAGFGYDVLVYKNLTAKQMVNSIHPRQMKEKGYDLEGYNSLVVSILSHGDKGTVYGVDGKQVLVNELKYAFNGGACPALQDKPKIFVILACQGGNKQGAKSLILTPSGLTSYRYKIRMGAGQLPVIDELSLMSTIEEFQAYSHKLFGSYFIQILCDQLQSEYGRVRNAEDEKKTRDLLHLFHSEVVPRLARRQTPESRSTLLRTIRFRKRDESQKGKIDLVFDGANDRLQDKSLWNAELFGLPTSTSFIIVSVCVLVFATAIYKVGYV